MINRARRAIQTGYTAGRTITVTVALSMPLVGLLYARTAIARVAVVVLGVMALTTTGFWVRRIMNDVHPHPPSGRGRSSTDDLTQLLNRTGVRAAVAGLDPTSIGLVCLDLDRFQSINDHDGHGFGDVVLRAVADRLRQLPEPVFAVGRVGGDEFAVLFAIQNERTAHDEGAQVAAAIRDALEAPLSIGRNSLTVRCSLGIAGPIERTFVPIAMARSRRHRSRVAYPLGASEALAELFRRADLAQLLAKRRGGARAVTYTDAMGQQIIREKTIGDTLDRLLEEGPGGRLWLAYQAIVEVPRGVAVGAEALARLEVDGLGPVNPAEFIPVAESIGMMDRFGRWVFDTAVAELDASTELADDFWLSVNLSPFQLNEASLEPLLALARDRPDLTARVHLEVTETAIIGEERLACLFDLAQAGYCIAIDDFGREYASLHHVVVVRPDQLKLDQAFTTIVVDDSRAQAVVRAVFSGSEEIGMDVIVEGVETAAQVDVLVDLGCRYVQGFLFDRPAPRLERFAADGGRMRPAPEH